MSAERPAGAGLRPFHLAFAVTDLGATRHFYTETLGAREARSAERWVDLDFFGHQLSAHLVDAPLPRPPTNPVDGDAVPANHFGVVLTWGDWHALVARLSARGQPFLIEPHVRFRGEPGEQATFFVLDPSGNALEFKAFADDGRLFAR